MHDQANDLRRLVRDCAAADDSDAESRPRLTVVASGKGGVGTTTVAVNLAVAAARAGRQTVLVDADQHGGDVATLCGLEERYTIADVLSGRRTVTEVLQLGPGAVGVLPGVWGLERLSDYPPAAGQRLLGQLRALGARADLVLIDAGTSRSRVLRPFWQAAESILMVTTAEVPSILDTYASIKALVAGENAGQIDCNYSSSPSETVCSGRIHAAFREIPPRGPDESGHYERVRRILTIYSLVNRAAGVEAARNVQDRLALACRRFLGVRLHAAGHLPNDPQAAGANGPFVLTMPDGETTRQIEHVAEVLATPVAPSDIRLALAASEEPQEPSRKTA